MQGCLGPAILFSIFVGLGAVGVVVTNNANRPTPAPVTVQPTSTLNQVPSTDPEDTSMKQGTFTFEQPTITPQPTAIPQAPSICSAANLAFDDEGASNSDSNIFIALDPPNGQPIATNRVIRAWVSDEAGGRLPASATVDASGNITAHSNPAVDKDSHGYPWEPALYLTQITSANVNGPYSGDKENGGTPRFPVSVKGKVTPGSASGWLTVPIHDDPLSFIIGNRRGDGRHVAEFIWNVDTLGLASGTYRAQVSVHDGDSHLAVECTTLTI